LAWTIEFDELAAKQLGKLAKTDAQRIRDFLRDRIAMAENPRSLGHQLQGSRFAGLWRYRTGDYRILCEIQDNRLIVLVVGIGHRREVYR
jgi:mRNA interferase RelE/StbE